MVGDLTGWARSVLTGNEAASRALEAHTPWRSSGRLSLMMVAADLGKVVLGLLDKPAVCGTTENLGSPDGRVRRYAALLVHEFRKRVAV
jgi:hypothetical protein